uniref:H15 domain-containing protein n=1 Tax=Macrostomum lignano TaxID=282301 RepID=A0A1I8F8M2_9PLAT
MITGRPMFPAPPWRSSCSSSSELWAAHRGVVAGSESNQQLQAYNFPHWLGMDLKSVAPRQPHWPGPDAPAAAVSGKQENLGGEGQAASPHQYLRSRASVCTQILCPTAGSGRLQRCGPTRSQGCCNLPVSDQLLGHGAAVPLDDCTMPRVPAEPGRSSCMTGGSANRAWRTLACTAASSDLTTCSSAAGCAGTGSQGHSPLAHEPSSLFYQLILRLIRQGHIKAHNAGIGEKNLLKTTAGFSCIRL